MNEEIAYSMVWEDYLVLNKALKISSSDIVLSIASAGCNVLAMLLKRPRKIIAIDSNPAQLALLDLKLVGIRRLDHHQFLSLFGLTQDDPLASYERVRRHLPQPAQNFWDKRAEVLTAGVMVCGKLERYFTAFRQNHTKPLGFFDKLRVLESLSSSRDRIRWIKSNLLHDEEFCEAFNKFFGQENMQKNGRDAQKFKYVEHRAIENYFFSRLSEIMSQWPIEKNCYLRFFWYGNFKSLRYAPIYFQGRNFEKLKSLVKNVHTIHSDLADYLSINRTKTIFSKANLSDIFEYLSENESNKIFDLLARTATPKARIIYWNLLVPRQAISTIWRPLNTLSERLGKEDRVWFYQSLHIAERT